MKVFIERIIMHNPQIMHNSSLCAVENPWKKKIYIVFELNITMTVFVYYKGLKPLYLLFILIYQSCGQEESFFLNLSSHHNAPH